MKKIILLVALCAIINTQSNATSPDDEYLSEYVKSFALRNSDTILIELSIPYEIIDWDKDIVRIFTRVESFSLPESILRRVSRMGRYRMRAAHKDGVMKIHLPDIHHKVVVSGIQLQEEVVAKIYVPAGFPLKVICSSKTKEEQLEDLWLQQEVLTRKLNFPIHRAINADHYYDVSFDLGEVVAAKAIKGTKRFLELQVKVGAKTYNLVSRVGKIYTIEELIGKQVVFVAHNLKEELKGLPNQGMILIKENVVGDLSLVEKGDLPDFFYN